MESQSDVRAQLRTLSIPKERRPVPENYARARTVRIWPFVLFVILLAAGFGGYSARDKIRAALSRLEPENPVRMMTVAATLEPVAAAVLTATGKIVSDHQVEVATKVSGQIVALEFEQGDRVEKGRILARVEDVLYRARRDEAAARLAKSKANLEYQRVNYGRVAELIQGSSAQPIEHADAKRWLEDAEAQLAADQASLDFAQKALDDTEVMAPISGVVLTRNVEVGDFVAAEGGRGANANAQFAIIADMTKLRVEVDVSELDINRIKQGMPCIITPDAYKDRRYNGNVMWLDPGANYSKATVQVKVRILDPDDRLRVEGSAQVAFLTEAPATQETAQRPPAIWIPKTACIEEPGGQTAKVFVAHEGRLQAKTITIGRRNGNLVEVTSGLSEGQSIVADGLEKLSDG